MRGTLPTLLAILLLSLPLMASAQVYKWKDAHGTEHFSDSPPPNGVKYKNLHTKANAAQPRVAPKKADDENAHARDQSDASSDSKITRYCKQIQSNIEMLKSKQPVNRIGDDGKRQQMGQAQRAKQLKIQQKRYEAYCAQ